MGFTTVLTLPCLVLLMFLSVTNAHKCCRLRDPKTLDCSGCSLEDVPFLNNTNITTLYLNNNLITDIKDDAFTYMPSLEYLSLRYNKLQMVNNNSFAGLEYLETLDITQTDGYLMSLQTFKPLTSLKKLKLGNVGASSPETFPKKVFISVSATLEFLEVSVPRNLTFGDEFSHLRNLKTLVLFGHSCSLGTVHNKTFGVFADSLETLELHDCKVLKLSQDSFSKFSKLETLNFACNRKLSLKGIFDAVKQMPKSTLKTLIIDGVNGGKNLNELKESWFNTTRLGNLKRFSFRQTNIVSIDFKFSFHVPKLEYLNCGYNSVLQATYPKNFTELIVLIDNSNITSVDLSYMGQSVSSQTIFRDKYCRDADLYSDDFFQKPPSQIIVPDPLPRYNHTIYIGDQADMLARNVPQSLLYFYASALAFPHGEIHDVTFNSDNNILVMDFSDTQVKAVHGPFNGLLQLQGFDLGGCGMEFIAAELLDTVPSLTLLNLTGNELSNTQWDRLFKNAHNLRVLDLSANRLQGVPENILAGVTSLEIALLNDNPLGELVLNLDNNYNLTLLDLRNTSLIVTQNLMDALDNLQRKIKHTLRVKLQGNLFLCDCKNLDFLKWLKLTANVVDNDTLQCEYKKNRHFISNVNLHELERSCTDTMRLMTILMTPLASVIAVLVLLVMVHNYRWSIKWKFYLIRRGIHYSRLRRRNRQDALPLVDDSTPYNAFVSYNHTEDYQWIQDTLLPQVEDQWGLKLCIGQRDFVPGIPIAENICESIDRSRYVILVVTPSFVTSEWCDFEMHMALVKGRRHLVIIYKEEVDVEAMSKSLRALMSSTNYIEYTDSPEGNALFWTRLQDKLLSHIDED